MTVIRKKILPRNFELIAAGKKRLELRLGDIEVTPGDTLVWEEWDNQKNEYTGRSIETTAMEIMATKDQKFWSEDLVKQHGFQIILFGTNSD